MCSQCLVLKPDGMIDVEKFCISCLVEHLRILVKELLHVEDLPGNLPVFCYFKKIAELPSGSNLVMDKEDAVDVEIPLLVCHLTPEEESGGMRYDGSEPFIINGRSYWPKCSGTWIHFKEVGEFAVRVWADNKGVTQHLKAQLQRAAHRSGTSIDTTKVSSKSCRRSMATLLSRKDVPISVIKEIGEWSSEEMVRKYIELLDALSPLRASHVDLMLDAVTGAGSSASHQVSDGGATDLGGLGQGGEGDGSDSGGIGAGEVGDGGSMDDTEGDGGRSVIEALAHDGASGGDGGGRDVPLGHLVTPVRRQAIKPRIPHKERVYSPAEVAAKAAHRSFCCPRIAGERSPLVKMMLRERLDIEALLLQHLWSNVADVQKALHSAGVCASRVEIESYRKKQPRKAPRDWV